MLSLYQGIIERVDASNLRLFWHWHFSANFNKKKFSNDTAN